MRAIFISYRREDTEGQAGHLFEDLVKLFGEQSVFMDVAGIEPGRDFRKAIDEHVASCGVLLALIGKNWVDARDEAGRRRIDDPLDFVRLETAAALKRDIPVVPVLVRGASMPRADQLPPDLADLAFRNAIELTHARWNSDLTVLGRALSPYITPSQPGKGQQASTEQGTQPVAPHWQIQRRFVMPILIATVIAVAGAAGVYFLKLSKAHPDWHFDYFPPPNAGYLAFTIMPDGNPACASENGHDCLWGKPIADLDFNKLLPLECGEMHKAEWGQTGYDIPTHWCNLAKAKAAAEPH
jgi:hypothetical protein